MTLKEAKAQVEEVKKIAAKVVGAFLRDHKDEWFSAKGISEGVNGIVTAQHIANVISNSGTYYGVPVRYHVVHEVYTERYGVLNDNNEIVRIIEKKIKRKKLLYAFGGGGR